jgi:hypothetical protein
MTSNIMNRDHAEQQETTYFTINAPSPITKETEERKKVHTDLTNDDAKEQLQEEVGHENYVETDNEEKLLASFTMAPPVTENFVFFNATLPSSDKNKTDDDVWQTTRNTETFVMATINVPALIPENTIINSNTKKTDLEDLTKTAFSTVTAISSVKNSNENINNRNSQLASDNTEPKINSKSTSPNEVSLMDGVNDNKLGDVREKRSLFDLDNANSLTLAEKLRNEANKYSTIHQIHTEQSATVPFKTEDATYDVSSSPINSTIAECRPSWRLKLDASSKV